MAARRPLNDSTRVSNRSSSGSDRSPSNGGRQATDPGRPAAPRRSSNAPAASRGDALPTTSAPAGPAAASATVPDSFAGFGLPPALLSALSAAGITSPFPIQAATLPDSLGGRDVLGRGRTGSGKTYAFLLPLLARLTASSTPRRAGRPRGLILVPTRELATQIETAVRPLARPLGLTVLTIFGGVGAGPQISGLRAGVDIVIACPGRLADHVSTGAANLGSIEVTVLDEADHMADLGFLPVVRRLLDTTPRDGQRLLFSATLDAGVDVLVRRFLHDPVTHSVDSAQSPVSTMSHHVLHVRADDRLPVLVDLTAAPGRTLVFTRTKHGAKRLTKQLVQSGVPAVELHGNLAQNARTRNLAAFSDGSAKTLVATDIAARGIHVDDVTLVIHADPPIEHKAYLHRSGRTARAGADGTVVTLMTDEQVADVRDLTRKAGIAPTTTRLRPGDPLLNELAPGDRTFTAAADMPVNSTESVSDARGPRSPGRSRGRADGAGRGEPVRQSRSGSPAGRRSGRGGTAVVHTSSSTTPRASGDRPTAPRSSTGDGAGGAAAFSSRLGGRRSR